MSKRAEYIALKSWADIDKVNDGNYDATFAMVDKEIHEIVNDIFLLQFRTKIRPDIINSIMNYELPDEHNRDTIKS